METRLRAELFRVGGLLAIHDLPVKRVFDERLAALARAPHSRDVRLVEGKERARARLGIEVTLAEAVVESESGERRGVFVRSQEALEARA